MVSKQYRISDNIFDHRETRLRQDESLNKQTNVILVCFKQLRFKTNLDTKKRFLFHSILFKVQVEVQYIFGKNLFKMLQQFIFRIFLFIKLTPQIDLLLFQPKKKFSQNAL